MKPRLKLDLKGRLHVLAAAPRGWTDDAADAFLRKHYGSRADFAARFGLPYGTVTTALTSAALKMAGPVAEVRQILGLESRPSKTSVTLVASHAKRKMQAKALMHMHVGTPLDLFGDRLREERDRLGLSQHAAAALCNVTVRSQRNYEHGLRQPDTSYLKAAHRAGFDVLYVLLGKRGLGSVGGADA